MTKEERLLKITTDKRSELSKLTKKLTKRKIMLRKIRDETSLQSPGFREFCSQDGLYLQILSKYSL